MDLVDGVRVVPLLVAVLVAALGTAGAAPPPHQAVGRRQRDLAVLRALGLRPRQAGSIVGWHTATLALVAVVVGLPLGLVLGRVVWTALAELSRVFVYVDVDIVGLGLVVARRRRHCRCPVDLAGPPGGPSRPGRRLQDRVIAAVSLMARAEVRRRARCMRDVCIRLTVRRDVPCRHVHGTPRKTS
jgi:hypothetical protein